NKILFAQNVVDAFGHISVRHDKDPRNRYLMARHLPPGMVTATDIVTFDLESNPLTHADKPQYSERFIHGEIYKIRPDVVSVVHCHARPLIPFGVAKGARLRPMFHMCGFLGCGVPIFEIRKAGGMTDMLIRTPALAKALAASLAARSAGPSRGTAPTLVGQPTPKPVFPPAKRPGTATTRRQPKGRAKEGEAESPTAEEPELSGKGGKVPGS